MAKYIPRSGRRNPFILLEDSEAHIAMRLFYNVPGAEWIDRRSAKIPANFRMLSILMDYCELDTEDEKLSNFISFEYAEDLRSARLNNPEKLPELSHSKAHLLRDYQIIGANFVAHNTACGLFDDMGLGKTAQSIIGLESTNSKSNILVVCPNTAKLQWMEEINKWSEQDLPINILAGTPKKRKEIFESFDAGWLICNYSNLIIDKYLTGPMWDWVIYDEAHYLKNKGTKRFSSAKRIKSLRKLFVTGTPMGNDVTDVWTMLHLIDSKRASAYWRFFNLFLDYGLDDHGRRIIFGPKNSKYLAAELNRFSIMRKKEEVAPDLPTKTYQDIKLDMTSYQKALYKKAVKEIRIEVESGLTVTIMSALARLIRLRQITSDPLNIGGKDESVKLDAVEEIVSGTDRGIIVFTVFIATAKSIYSRLSKSGVECGIIIGETPLEERENVRIKLNSGEIKVAVVNIRAGGVGLNMQGASIAIFVDKEWNPLYQEQAENRIHRIGQNENVHIISLMCKGTVDYYVEQVVKSKKEMTDSIAAEMMNSIIQESTGV